MVRDAIWATVQARPGREKEVEAFLRSAQPLAAAETKTIDWYALDMGEGRFAIFDTFEDESGREAHLGGKIAQALTGEARALLDGEPQIHRIDVLAVK
jgi:quinol monooxygenase YgiN